MSLFDPSGGSAFAIVGVFIVLIFVIVDQIKRVFKK